MLGFTINSVILQLLPGYEGMFQVSANHDNRTRNVQCVCTKEGRVGETTTVMNTCRGIKHGIFRKCTVYISHNPLHLPPQSYIKPYSAYYNTHMKKHHMRLKCHWSRLYVKLLNNPFLRLCDTDK